MVLTKPVGTAEEVALTKPVGAADVVLETAVGATELTLNDGYRALF